jgi:hypothetical protein
MAMGKNGFSFSPTWIILLLLCFVNCSNRETKIDPSFESLKIYKLLIYQFYSKDENETVFINSYSLPLNNRFRDRRFSFHPGIDQNTLKDYFRKNQSSSYIASDFPLDVEYRFLSFKDDWEDKERNRKLKNLMRRIWRLTPYSDKKIIEFSKVGFNKKADQAIVSYTIYETMMPDEVDDPDSDDYVILPFPREVLLEKKLGPFPHIWTIKLRDLRGNGLM